MNKIFLSAIVGLITLALVQAAETQKQPEAGAPAPDFSLTTSDGGQVSLKDYRGKWVVLYFYPKDFTSGCTLEVMGLKRTPAREIFWVKIKHHPFSAIILQAHLRAVTGREAKIRRRCSSRWLLLWFVCRCGHDYDSSE